jgi:hypothetical protein
MGGGSGSKAGDVAVTNTGFGEQRSAGRRMSPLGY